jgi:hypothetical protein
MIRILADDPLNTSKIDVLFLQKTPEIKGNFETFHNDAHDADLRGKSQSQVKSKS